MESHAITLSGVEIPGSYALTTRSGSTAARPIVIDVIEMPFPLRPSLFSYEVRGDSRFSFELPPSFTLPNQIRKEMVAAGVAFRP